MQLESAGHPLRRRTVGSRGPGQRKLGKDGDELEGNVVREKFIKRETSGLRNQQLCVCFQQGDAVDATSVHGTYAGINIMYFVM